MNKQDYLLYILAVGYIKGEMEILYEIAKRTGVKNVQ